MGVVINPGPKASGVVAERGRKNKKTSSTNRTRKTPGELFLNWGTQSFYRVPNSGCVNHCSSPPPSTLRGSVCS